MRQVLVALTLCIAAGVSVACQQDGKLATPANEAPVSVVNAPVRATESPTPIQTLESSTTNDHDQPPTPPAVRNEVPPERDEPLEQYDGSDPKNWPRTQAEAVSLLKRILRPSTLKQLKELSQDELIRTHHGLGQWVRNNLGIWKGNKDLMRDCNASHGDDASYYIIEALWKDLNARSEPDPKD